MKTMIALLIALTACTRTDPAEADRAAAEYMHNFPGATSVSCARTDSDGDGYCSCTVFRGAEEPEQIQCGCEAICIWNCVRGCKYEPSFKISGKRRAQ